VFEAVRSETKGILSQKFLFKQFPKVYVRLSLTSNLDKQKTKAPINLHYFMNCPDDES